jgi:uncharacterized SAM-binding protein YcdF (DUF218 family)
VITRRWIAGMVLVPPLAWLAGFAWFLHGAQTARPAAPAHVDGIVALTGAPGRIDAALRLLAAGRADRLLVSGVATGAALEDIAHETPNLPALSARTTLGHVATSTHGNAEEASDWAHRHHLHSLLVVTSDWHVPRAMAELSRAMPDLALYPVPVPSEAEHDPTGSLAGWRLLAGEYNKWLAVKAGLERVHRDTPRPLSRAMSRGPSPIGQRG